MEAGLWGPTAAVPLCETHRPSLGMFAKPYCVQWKVTPRKVNVGFPSQPGFLKDGQGEKEQEDEDLARPPLLDLTGVSD